MWKRMREKNEETTVPWADLPQIILGIILGKLLSAVDVIRFRAVCKNWNIDILKDYEDHRNLPWLCNLDWSEKNPDLLECEMYDPYSRQIFKTSKLVVESGMESRRYTGNNIHCLGSKQGWLLIVRYHDKFSNWEIFMYNPYSNDCISLPFIWKYKPHFATFSGNPAVSSNDCRVFLFVNEVFSHHGHDYIASYGLNRDCKEWEIESIRVVNLNFGVVEGCYDVCCGMQYMNEQLFCLFRNGKVIRYNLADKSRTSIYLIKGGNQLARENRLWLAQGEGDLLVVVGRKLGFDCSVCWSFLFVWSNMSWVGSDLEEGTAVFTSGAITSFVWPFVDKDDVENNKACKVYSFEENKEPSGYSFAEIRKREKHLYGRLFSSLCPIFIEPPRIN